MFLVRLQIFDPLVEATSRLAQIAREADVKFTPKALWIIASNSSHRIVAALQMSHHFFTSYSVDQDHSSRISLQPFHDAMLDGGPFPSMTIHLLEKINQMILRFEPSMDVPQLHHELILSPSKEQQLEEIDYESFFSLDSQILRRVIKELPLFQDDSVCVTVTDSQIKFSIRSKQIIVPKECFFSIDTSKNTNSIFSLKGEHCRIVGYKEGYETQFEIILLPMLFFLNFTYEARRIWFYTTVDYCHGVMRVPAFGSYAQYLVYFTKI